MKYELKITPRYFELIRSGRKTFEVRLGDRNFQKGDTLVLHEFDSGQGIFTGKKLEVEVKERPVSINFWTAEQIERYGIVAMQIYYCEHEPTNENSCCKKCSKCKTTYKYCVEHFPPFQKEQV